MIVVAIFFAFSVMMFIHSLRQVYYNSIVKGKLKSMGNEVVSIKGILRPKEIPEYVSKSNFLVTYSSSLDYALYRRVVCKDNDGRFYSCYVEMIFNYVFFISDIRVYELMEMQ